MEIISSFDILEIIVWLIITSETIDFEVPGDVNVTVQQRLVGVTWSLDLNMNQETSVGGLGLGRLSWLLLSEKTLDMYGPCQRYLLSVYT